MCSHKLYLFLSPLRILAWLSQCFSASPQLLHFKNRGREKDKRLVGEVLGNCSFSVYTLLRGVPKSNGRTSVVSMLYLASRLFYFDIHCLTEKGLHKKMRPLLGSRSMSRFQLSLVINAGPTSTTLKIHGWHWL